MSKSIPPWCRARIIAPQEETARRAVLGRGTTEPDERPARPVLAACERLVKALPSAVRRTARLGAGARAGYVGRAGRAR